MTTSIRWDWIVKLSAKQIHHGDTEARRFLLGNSSPRVRLRSSSGRPTHGISKTLVTDALTLILPVATQSRVSSRCRHSAQVLRHGVVISAVPGIHRPVHAGVGSVDRKRLLHNAKLPALATSRASSMAAFTAMVRA